MSPWSKPDINKEGNTDDYDDDDDDDDGDSDGYSDDDNDNDVLRQIRLASSTPFRTVPKKMPKSSWPKELK